MFAMTCTLFFFLALPVQEAKLIIDNNRVTVREVRIPALSERKGKPLTIGARGNDVVAIDLDRTTAYFVPKGTTHPRPQHGIVIELKNMSVPPLENKTKYPLAFPRPDVKMGLENNRVIIWDYTWPAGNQTPMHFHDKDVAVVYLADGELKSTTPEGEVDITPISFGLTKFNRANGSHTEEVTKGSARAIIVELK